ncbi:MAG TPA: GAF domain-containing protein [Kofleriaceae bacterium]|jgi:GAF domain-containing protein
MAESVSFGGTDKASRYAELMPQVSSLIDGQPDLIANLANVTAVLRDCLPAASWVGFYIMRGAELVLGPFQGKVACTNIALGRGVCGTAAAQNKTLVVPDVEQFPGHIACDAGSRSEIVLPIVSGDRVVAVLDLDSYELAAFDDVDAANLAPLADLLGTLAW